MSKQRMMPIDTDAEQAVLGASIDNADACAEVVDVLKSGDFAKPDHREIFHAIVQIFSTGRPVDIFTVIDELRRRDVLHQVGGKPYLHELIASYSTASAARQHAELVVDYSRRRGLIQAAHRISDLGYAAPEGAAHAVDEAQRLVYEIAASDSAGDPLPTAELVSSRMHVYEELEKLDGALLGVPSGYPELDQMTRGFKPGQFVIVAARPGHGKSAWMANVAAHVATTGNGGVGMFSLEMSRDELMDRMLAADATVHLSSILSGKLNGGEWERLSAAGGRIASATLQIDDRTDATIMQLRSRSRRLKARGLLDLIIVDYIQLMTPPQAENRQQEVAEISRALKLLARDLEVPVICAAQLNRNLEYRADKRPGLGDLRESGALEQDSDIVLFLYREELYQSDGERTGATELIVGKHRNGPTGSVQLIFESQFTRFTSHGQMESKRAAKRAEIQQQVLSERED
jgi:replicative DNA helicase